MDSTYKNFSLNFVGTLILLRIPQRANIGSCSGFCKCKRIPQTLVDFANLCGFRLQFADFAYNLRIKLTIFGVRSQFSESAYNLRILLTICGVRLQFADSAYNFRIPLTDLQLRILRQLKFTKLIYYYLLMDSTNSFRIPQSCPFLERFWAIQYFSYLSVKSNTLEKIEEK